MFEFPLTCSQQNRETLLALSPGNAEYFHVLDSAMFVLCLDEGSPDTPEELARQGYIGDGANRWYDKVLQFWVSANGRSGQISEHGAIDGTTPARLLEFIADGMASYTPHPRNGSTPPHTDIQLNEVTLQVTPKITAHTNTLRARYRAVTSASTYVRAELTAFGTEHLARSHAPVKGAIDLTFQLALRLFFGRAVPAWEPTSASYFHAGRADALQRATKEANAFCDAAAEAAQRGTVANKGGLRALLLAATKAAHAGMRELLQTGESYLKLFEVLSYLWPAAVEKPAFLRDMVFFGRPFPPVWAQSNALESDIIVDDFVQLLPDKDGFWCIMVPEKNR